MRLLLFLSAASATPFLGQQQSLVNPSASHYSVQLPSEWPLNLTQYTDQIVIRVSSPYNEAYKLCKELKQCSVWANSQGFLDLKLPEALLPEFGNTTHEVIISDLAQLIYETFPKEDVSISDLSAESELFFKEYRPLKTIYSWFNLLAETYPDLVLIRDFGTTYEGQKLKALVISTRQFLEENPSNKTILIGAGIHAREWILVTSANYIIFQLLTKYGVSKPETDYLNHLNIVVIPVFNPDGYTYTWNSDRLWRKNRQETYHPRCFGIDLDHSFDAYWQKTEDTDWPCDEDYSGEAASEAIEVSQFSYYMNKTLTEHEHLKIYGYLDLHSYAQEILYPYAYSCKREPRDKENLLELGYGLSKAIRVSSGKHYEVFPACQDKNVDLSPGLGSGSSLDYMYSKFTAHWAFQIKLRDSGSHGFLLPAKYIRPVGEEVYEAVKYFFDFILDPEL